MKRIDAFLLFEVLVAILVASTTMVVVMQGMGNALRGGNSAESYFKALLLAEARMAFLEKDTSVKEGANSGRFNTEQDNEGKFLWEESIKAVTKTTSFSTSELPICEVIASAKWKEVNNEKRIALVTYLPKYEETAAEK